MRILASTGFISILARVIQAVSGICIVRVLSSEDYALFTIANTLQACMTTVSDGGVGSALLVIGGTIWADDKRMSELVAAAASRRWALMRLAIVVMTPICFWLLLRNGASFFYTAFIVTAILVEQCYYLMLQVLITVPRLRSHHVNLRYFQIVEVAPRAILIFCAAPIKLTTGIAVWISTVTTYAYFRVLRSSVSSSIDLNAAPSKTDAAEIDRIVIRTIPGVILYIIQGQINVLMLSVFSTSQSVASLGVLSRFDLLFTAWQAIYISTLIPSFSRCIHFHDIVVRYVQIMVLSVIVCAAAILAALSFPAEILWVFGEKYCNLHAELLLSAIKSSEYFLFGVIFSLNSSKGWIALPLPLYGMTIIGQVLGLCMSDVSTVYGVLTYNIVCGIPAGLILGLYLAVSGMLATARHQSQVS